MTLTHRESGADNAADDRTSPAASSPRNPSRCPASPPATPRCAPSAAPATTCTIAATTSSTSPTSCEFEEIAHLLVHGKLPNARGARRLQGASCKRLRGLPGAGAHGARGSCRPRRHPMDVMRTGVSVLGCALPEKDDHNAAGARDIADRLMASPRLDAAVLVPLQPQRPAHRRRDRRRLDRRALPAPAARRPPPASWVQAMHTSLILYAEHEFNASTFAARVIAGTGSDIYSCDHRRDRRAARPEARRRQRGRVRDPEPLRHARRGRGGHPRARRGEGSDHRLRPSGLHGLRSAQQGHQGSRARAVAGSRRHEDVRHRRAPRDGDVGREEDVPEPRLVLAPCPTT